MKPFAIDPEDVTPDSTAGRILCHDVVSAGETGRVRLAKGRILDSDDVAVLRSYSGEIHLLELEEGDVHEDVASMRLARAVAGDGIVLRGPVESQTLLRSTGRGVLQVRTTVLSAINELPDMSVYTLYDGQPVTAGKAIGATKVTPLAVPGGIVDRAEEIAREGGPVLSVRHFHGGTVGVVVRERLADRAREKFENAIHMKVGWFGSPVADIRYLRDDVSEIANALEELLIDGVSLILAAGVNSTDPLDLTIQALSRIGAETEKRGVPAHPGSTCWLAYHGETPIFGLALCGMFSQTTVLDLLLPRFLSGSPVRTHDIAALGHGGLLGKEMAFRFPSYNLEGD